MKKLYTILFLLAFATAPMANSQQTLYSDDFETGYTNAAALAGVNGWQVFGATPIVKSIENTGAGFNGSDWYIEISTGKFQQIQKVYTLVSGETYEFKIQAIRTNGTDGGLKVQAFKLGGTPILITESPTTITNGAYQQKSITFVANESVNHGFRITQISGTSFMQIDDVEITCTSCAPLSTEDHSAFEFAMYPNPVKNVLNINTQEPLQKIEVTDLLGRTVLSKGNVSKSIDVSSLIKGVYILKLTSEKGISTKKIIKE